MNWKPYSTLEQNYRIEQRVQDKIKEHGSIKMAIEYCELELKACEDNWSDYSYDCVGHAITCIRLLLPRLKENQLLELKDNGRIKTN